MRLTDIALHNLRVRRTKMLFLVLGMIVGTATIVTLSAITGAMREQVRTQFEELGTKLLVTPYTERFSLSYNGVAVASTVSYEARELPPGALAAARALPGRARARVVAPKLLAVTQFAGRRYLVAGVSFPSEFRLNRHWEVAGRAPTGAGEVLLGHTAAARLGKRPGDVVEFEGTRLSVAGVLSETGAQEDPLLFMDLKQAQSIFGKPGAVSFVELSVSRQAAQQAIDQLKGQLPGVRITAVVDQGEARREVADRLVRFSLLITLVVLVAGSLIIGTTMMSSVNERTREIGIFRAVGFRRTHIMRIILTEAAMVSALGGALGYLAGMGAASLAAPLVAQLQVQVRWNPLLGGGVILLSVLVGLSASLYPAVRAARLDPAEALRFL